MPDMEASDRHQVAVLWAWSSNDIDDVKVSAGVEIDVRWQWKYQETRAPDGSVVETVASVVVDADLTIGGIMWLGRLADFVDGASDLYQIVQKKETPDLKNRATRRKVFLTRYRQTLPTIE